MNKKTTVSDQLKTLAANALYIPSDLTLAPWNIKAPFSELNWQSYASSKSVLNTIKHYLIPVKERRTNIRNGYVLPISGASIKDNESWFFINGLGSSRELSQLNGSALAELFGRKINLLFNASEGLLKDVSECLTGRLGENSQQVASSLCKLLESELRKRDKVVLIAHSQGGMISLTAAAKLVERIKQKPSGKALLSKLEIYTFGSAELCPELSNDIYVEHFANRDDLIVRVRVFSKENPNNAELFVYDQGRGHLLNSHYLPYFKAGKFHRKHGLGSRLSTYLKCA